MQIPFCLVLYGSNYLGVAMPQATDGHPRYKVEMFPSVTVIDIASLGMGDFQSQRMWGSLCLIRMKILFHVVVLGI
jgi:hypothetical protein